MRLKDLLAGSAIAALLALCLIPAIPVHAQDPTLTKRWFATTGNISQTGSAYTATMQRSPTQKGTPFLDYIVVYTSAAAPIQQYANGALATATAGTVQTILPSNLTSPPDVQFWTASNVGTGTAQGGLFNNPAGNTQSFCLSPSCNTATVQVFLPTAGNNYSVTVGAYTGTTNITFYGRDQQ